MTENAIATQIVDAAYRIHRELGPGLLEFVYEIVLAAELKKRGLQVLRQHPVPTAYEGLQFQIGFRADLVVQDLALVEVKSVEMIAPVHQKQLLTYLKLTDRKLGLLINFNVNLIKDGIKRVVNGLSDDHAKARSSQS